ncbi:hypothetical protein BJV74DRAFT_836047 [Russula compacta]|nr:hypothetical protein BJV74DRAFT_836047 [Russula compacta]
MLFVDCLGAEHGDLEPQNVLRKRLSCLKIIDFGFSDECGELKDLWRRLELDRTVRKSQLKSMVQQKLKTRSVAGLKYRLLFFVMILLALLMTSGIPVNWRTWPRIY